MESILANLVGRSRRTVLRGREQIIVPMTMIVPGVLNGSKGPLYYPPDEIAKTADAWNGMPLVVYHPQSNGQHVSARTPAILEKQQVGRVFNATITEDGKLKADGWFDVENTRHIDDRVLTSLLQSKPIELSTGLFTDNEPAENDANYDGQPYSFVARNYRPDHLAILPDQKGACSLSDGCGVLVNKKINGYSPAIANYNQPRDSKGRFGSGGGGGGAAERRKLYKNEDDWKSDERHFAREIKKADKDVVKAKKAVSDKQKELSAKQAEIQGGEQKVKSLKTRLTAVQAKIAGAKKAQEASKERMAALRAKLKGNFNPNQPRDGKGRLAPGGGGGGMIMVEPKPKKKKKITAQVDKVKTEAAGVLSKEGQVSIDQSISKGVTQRTVVKKKGGEYTADIMFQEKGAESFAPSKQFHIGSSKKTTPKQAIHKATNPSLTGPSEVEYGLSSEAKVRKSKGTTKNSTRNSFTVTYQGELAMKKKELIDQLIENSCCWDEEDRGVLDGLSDEKLIAHHQAMLQESKAEVIVNAAVEGFEDGLGNTHTWNEETGEFESVENEPPPQFLKKKKGATKPPAKPGAKPGDDEEEEEEEETANTWLEKAPPEIRSTIENAMAIENHAKEGIVDRLVANMEDKQQKADLRKQLLTEPLAKLQNLALLSPPTANEQEDPAPSYLGAATPTGNVRDKIDREDILALPVLNFEEEEKASA